jgi:protocatechuate 3,4-dioxygenase, alpha subunit
MRLVTTPNGPIGPFFHFALTDQCSGIIVGPRTKGERIKLTVRVLDSAGVQVTNAMIELWQADANGIYNNPADPAFTGFGRLASDEEGLCVFETVKPGPVTEPDGGTQAPHINVSVYAPGLLRRITTRIYFAGDPANDSDFTLSLAPPSRRETLLAKQGDEANQWLFDLYLAGDSETVFFDV